MALLRGDIETAARRLIDDGYGLYLASNRDVLGHLRTDPFGIPILGLDLIGPPQHAWTEADMMRVYNVLNATAFGDKGIPLQNWVMIDLGLLPSAFLLITLSVEQAREARSGRAPGDGRSGLPAARARTARILAAVLAEADRLGYTGPIPVAGYCAAPTPARDEWVGWSLCSAIPGLGTTAKGLALEVYRAQRLLGVAQFSDQGLRVHRRFGPMELVAPTLDLHPVPHTMIYRTHVHGEEPSDEPTFWMHCRDGDAQRTMQARVDAGTHRYFILPPGLVDDQVPILELDC